MGTILADCAGMVDKDVSATPAVGLDSGRTCGGDLELWHSVTTQ